MYLIPERFFQNASIMHQNWKKIHRLIGDSVASLGRKVAETCMREINAKTIEEFINALPMMINKAHVISELVRRGYSVEVIFSVPLRKLSLAFDWEQHLYIHNTFKANNRVKITKRKSLRAILARTVPEEVLAVLPDAYFKDVSMLSAEWDYAEELILRAITVFGANKLTHYLENFIDAVPNFDMAVLLLPALIMKADVILQLEERGVPFNVIFSVPTLKLTSKFAWDQYSNVYNSNEEGQQLIRDIMQQSMTLHEGLATVLSAFRIRTVSPVSLKAADAAVLPEEDMRALLKARIYVQDEIVDSLPSKYFKNNEILGKTWSNVTVLLKEARKKLGVSVIGEMFRECYTFDQAMKTIMEMVHEFDVSEREKRIAITIKKLKQKFSVNVGAAHDMDDCSELYDSETIDAVLSVFPQKWLADKSVLDNKWRDLIPIIQTLIEIDGADKVKQRFKEFHCINEVFEEYLF